VQGAEEFAEAVRVRGRIMSSGKKIRPARKFSVDDDTGGLVGDEELRDRHVEFLAQLSDQESDFSRRRGFGDHVSKCSVSVEDTARTHDTCAECFHPMSQFAVSGDHGAGAIYLGGNEFDDLIVAGTGGVHHLDGGGRLDAAGLPFHNEDDVGRLIVEEAVIGPGCVISTGPVISTGIGEMRKAVAESLGGTFAVAPPAVRAGTHHICSIDHDD
jgi:hypothetical protein